MITRNEKGQFVKGHELGIRFNKGFTPWNKNKKGIHLSPKSQFKKGRIPWNKGLTKNDPRVLKYSKTQSIVRMGRSSPMKGKKHKEISKKKMSLVRKGRIGNNANNWQGGITPIHTNIRNSKEYQEWRNSVFIRDDYTCQECGLRGGNLNAHHIKSFSKHPELRLSVLNGLTLCFDCHKSIRKSHAGSDGVNMGVDRGK